MIDLEIPKKFGPLVEQAHQVAHASLPADLAQVRPRRARLPEGARHARRADRRHERRRRHRRRRRRRRRLARRVERRPTAQPQRLEHVDRRSAIMETLLGRRRPALSMPRQGLGNSAIASVADRRAARALRRQVGGDGDHRARGRLGLGGDPHHRGPRRTTSTSSTARRSTSRPASAPTSSSSGPRSTAQGRAAIKSFVVERDNPGMKLDRLEHKLGIRASRHRRVPPRGLPRAEGGPARQPRRSTPRRASRGAMQTFDNTRPLVAAMAVGVARACLDDTPRGARRGRASRSTTTARRTASPPRPPSCSRWRPTTRPPAC